jgi:curved DNA-binding protein CbpA
MHIVTASSVAVLIVSVSCFNFPIKQRWILHSIKQPLVVINRNLLYMAAADMNWDPKSGPKLDFNEDFYSLLEIDPAIDSKAMKKAYYKIVFKYHPDNKEGEAAKELCNKQMMVINAAYKVLKDSDARIAYDRKRSMGVYGEAAKVGKAAGSSSNSKTQTQSQKSSSSSSCSSSSSSSSSGGSNPFGNYGYNPDNAQNYEATESLGDIFGDLFQSVRTGDSKNFVGDLLDFLEDQVYGMH